MILDTIAQEIALAVGIGCLRWVWRFARVRVLAWLRDFALVDPGGE